MASETQLAAAAPIGAHAFSVAARRSPPVRGEAAVFGIDNALAAAVRAALGLPQALGAPRLIAEEALRAHAHRILVQWPRVIRLNCANDRPPQAHEALGEAPFGPAGMPADLGCFETWLQAGRSAPARVLRRLWNGLDSRWGRAQLPLLTTERVTGRLDWLRAELDGHAVENTTAARLAETDLLRAIEARRGRGPVWRLTAQLSDCARLLAALGVDGAPEAASAPSPGSGAAPVASGTLLVRALAGPDGAPARIESLTPERCLAHPQGLATATREARPPGAPVTPAELTGLLALTIGAPVSPWSAPQGRMA